MPTELVVYPGEPHGLTKLSNRIAKMEWDLAWFEKYSEEVSCARLAATPTGRRDRSTFTRWVAAKQNPAAAAPRAAPPRPSMALHTEPVSVPIFAGGEHLLIASKPGPR